MATLCRGTRKKIIKVPVIYCDQLLGDLASRLIKNQQVVVFENVTLY
jgi:hypothetical protein